MSAAPAPTVAILAETPNRLAALLRDVPADRLDWKPSSWEGSPGEGFSIREHVCHLRDIEADGYVVRIRRLRDETNPSLVSLDGFALAKERDYASADVGAALLAYRSARAETLEMVERLTPDDLRREGDFAEYGRVTLKGLLHYLASHDQQHLACVEWLRGKMDA